MEMMPFFMENKEWYIYDEKTNTYTLTAKAPKKAKESFEEFLKNRGKPYDWFSCMTQAEKVEFFKREHKRMEKLIAEDKKSIK